MMRFSRTMTAIAIASFPAAVLAASPPARNVVLVHGGLVDGSVWRPVYDILTKDGYKVSIVQNGLQTMAEDVAATKRVLDQQTGPVVLVGQSIGGSIITEAGADPKVVALVYVAALQPDQGENAADLNAKMPAASANDVKGTADYYYDFPPALFPALVAADVPLAQARFMAASQQPMGGAMFSDRISIAAWRTKPSYAIVATEDKSLNPDLQRFMYKRAGATITEIKASHAVFLSKPAAVAKVIKQAAEGKK
jgi:pimeloyl-ACP methyl ester carboxylesterase